MEYEETYHGVQLVITTEGHPEGHWTSSAELLDGDQRTAVPAGTAERYGSEEEARRGALSSAAAALDRGRTSRGKP